jgi:hypothetical protein
MLNYEEVILKKEQKLCLKKLKVRILSITGRSQKNIKKNGRGSSKKRGE